MPVLHVVAHTHWDREWYAPMARFRQQLVALVDELLDDPPPSGASFLLDGQAIVLEDYLAVRPERRGEVVALLRDGRLEAGPWLVLADTLIPSGEALVRNLLAGRRALRALRADAPPVLYCPDSFGHPAVLPAIAEGFGCSLLIVWRGFGGRRWPSTDRFVWRGNGASVVAYHLPQNGYETGADLPTGAAAAVERWSRLREQILMRARGEVALIPNGADHHARQRDQGAAVAALSRAAERTGDTVLASSLGSFARAIADDVRAARLPVVEGELRDSYGFTWTLQGTFATRAAQKRRNARVERLLVRDVEPWVEQARRAGAPDRRVLVDAAWRSLLECHPHDTLCGCSIDDVARAMDRRLADARAQGVGLRGDAIADLAGHDAERARALRARWSPIVLLRNAAPRARGGVAFVELERFVADVPVGPGSARSAAATRDGAHAAAPAPAAIATVGGRMWQSLGSRRANRRVESPRHYPDNDLVDVERGALWCPPIAGYAVEAVPLDSAGVMSMYETPVAAPEHPVRAAGRALDNGLLRVHVGRGGEATLTDRASGRVLRSLLVVGDDIDRGDCYTPSIRGAASRPRVAGVRLLHRGPLVGELRVRVALDDDDETAAPSSLVLSLRLIAGSPLLFIDVRGHNRRDDHRLRVGVRTGIAGRTAFADAAFGPIERRPIEALAEEDLAMETPPATAPLHRYVSRFDDTRGATLYSDGLAEYEATDDGTLLVTLVRAVGALSRNDLPERPGHAGWPAPTPRAQSRGAFAARLALLLHGARDAHTIDVIERAADDVLLPLRGDTLRSALHLPPSVRGLELEGEGLAFSSMKTSEDGRWTVLRCVNLLDVPVRGSWRLGAPVEAARFARLDETPLDPLVVEGARVEFEAAPRAIVTILAR